MSVIPLEADIHQHEWHVRYVPKTDIFELPIMVLRQQEAIKSGLCFGNDLRFRFQEWAIGAFG